MKSSFLITCKAKTVFIIFIILWIAPVLISSLINLPSVLSKATIPLFIIFPFLWAYAIGINLHRIIFPEDKIYIVLSSVSISIGIICLYISIFFFFGSRMINSPNEPLPLIMLVNIAFIYICISSAKRLLIAEKRKNINFNTIGNTFLLFLFFPIGVWFIQPRVNKILNNLKNGA